MSLERGGRAVKWYKCLIVGANFPGEMIGEEQRVGFYTTQFVQDETREAAELKALAQLRAHKSLQLPKGADRPADARVYFEDIIEVSADEVDDTELGLSFFPMEQEK